MALEIDEQTHGCSGQKGWGSKTFFYATCSFMPFLEEGILGQEKSPLHIDAVYVSASEVMFHFWATHSMYFSRLKKNAVI